MGRTFVYRRRVEFSETDMAGIMHFANYHRYMEAAEHALFRSVELSIHTEVDGRMVCWPRVKTECEFLKPLRFEDEVDVHLTVRELAVRRMVCDYEFRRAGDAEPVARGSMTTVCCELNDEGLRPIEIPPVIRQRLEAGGDA